MSPKPLVCVVTSLCSRADQRPELPAVQPVAMPHIEKRIKIIVGDDVALPRLAVNRKHDEENFVAKQPVLEMAVKRNERGVIFIRVRRALLEINREKGEALFSESSCGSWPPAKLNNWHKLPAIFRAVAFVGQQRIKKIIFPRFNGGIRVVRKQRRNGPGLFRILLLVVKKRPDGFGAMTRHPASAEIGQKAGPACKVISRQSRQSKNSIARPANAQIRRQKLANFRWFNKPN